MLPWQMQTMLPKCLVPTADHTFKFHRVRWTTRTLHTDVLAPCGFSSLPSNRFEIAPPAALFHTGAADVDAPFGSVREDEPDGVGATPATYMAAFPFPGL